MEMNKDKKLDDLKASVQDHSAFTTLADYYQITATFLQFLQTTTPTRIISPNPTVQHYIFFQYPQAIGFRITRPLNSRLFIESVDAFKQAWEQFAAFLVELKRKQTQIKNDTAYQQFTAENQISKIVYTIQQSMGCIGDAFDNSNQSRKRVGQLFENVIKLIIKEVGLECEPRRVLLPVIGFEGYTMSYELDLVFSENKAILTFETVHIHPHEIVGSVKTTSKDRIDKIFLDKFLLSKRLGRDIKVIAVFLHDVQRAKFGNSIFGINSTFKSNHFLGYTLALNKLNGVYYVDPRPEMFSNQKLREQSHNFQEFLLSDIWELIKTS
jgi:hypothetical protein